jgi:hypothetical protein
MERGGLLSALLSEALDGRKSAHITGGKDQWKSTSSTSGIRNSKYALAAIGSFAISRAIMADQMRG